MDIAERIQMVIHNNELTNAAFADKIGVQRSNISHVLSGRSKPSMDFLAKVIKEFPRVSAHWLLTGEQASVRQGLQESQLDLAPEKTSAKTSPELKNTTSKTDLKPEPGNEKTIDYVLIVNTDGTFKKIISED